MTTIPNTEPVKIIAGDSVSWRKSLSEYPASDGWVLKYALRGGGSAIDLIAAADGDDHLITITAAISAAYVAGDYTWTSFVTKTTERYTISTGPLTIEPDPVGQAADVDLRSHAKIVLDAIDAVLEGRATTDQEEIEIEGEKLKRTPIADLLKMRSFYITEYQREIEAEKIAKGLATGRRVLTRM